MMITGKIFFLAFLLTGCASLNYHGISENMQLSKRNVIYRDLTKPKMPGNKGQFVNLNIIAERFSNEKQQNFVDPLILSVRTVWEPNFKTVKDVAEWVLEPTDYKLVENTGGKMNATFYSSIPAVLKMNRTIPIVDVLQLLIGEENKIIIDRKNKLIGFLAKN